MYIIAEKTSYNLFNIQQFAKRGFKNVRYNKTRNTGGKKHGQRLKSNFLTKKTSFSNFSKRQ